MTTFDLSCLACCGSDNSSASSASSGDGCVDQGTCIFTWDGALWNPTTDNCAADGTTAPNDPGCTYEACMCGVPFDNSDGTFIGETREGCCICALNCLP